MDSYIKKGKPKPLLFRIANGLLIVLMLGTSSALVASYLAPILNPYYFWYIAFLGLAVPVLMLANLVFLLIFGIKLSKWAFVPLATLLLGIGYVGDFLQINILSEHNSDRKPLRGEFSLMTYNVHAFVDYDDINRSTRKEIVDYIVEKDPDIICFQEFISINDSDNRDFDNKMNRWKYRAQSFTIENQFSKMGLAVYSKYPLTNATAIKFTDGQNSSMYVDVLIRDDTVRLFNNHLQSTQLNTFSKKKLQDKAAEEAALMVGSKLRHNYRLRVFQADTIGAIIRKSPYPALVAGDFNDTPMSYVYSTIKGGMKDTFREKGKGYEYTYKPLMKLFRIDYILHSQEIETINHDSPEAPWSDHKPVLATMKVGMPK